MGSSTPLTTNWGDLPVGVKRMILSHMDSKTRQALKHCSRQEKCLVESIPINVKLAEITIGQIKKKTILSCNLELGKRGWATSSDFDEFNEKLKRIGCIERLKVRIHIHLNQRLFKHSIKVRSLHMFFDKVSSSNVINTIRSIDPDYLESVQMTYYEECDLSSCFDLPQITRARKLYALISSMTDRQLLKLEATDLTIGHSDFITNHGLNAYVKKCLSKLDDSHINFKITRQKHDSSIITEGLDIIQNTFEDTDCQSFIINSTSSRYQLYLEHFGTLLRGFRIEKQ